MVYWVQSALSPRVGVAECPRGGRPLPGEARRLREEGVGALVSLLTPMESDVFGLEGEAAACERAGIRFHSFPVVDGSVPDSAEQYRALLEELERELAAGRAVAAHCRGGIGRSPSLIACLLCLKGMDPHEAFDRISSARGLVVPELTRQALWVQQFAAKYGPPPTAG